METNEIFSLFDSLHEPQTQADPLYVNYGNATANTVLSTHTTPTHFDCNSTDRINYENIIDEEVFMLLSQAQFKTHHSTPPHRHPQQQSGGYHHFGSSEVKQGAPPQALDNFSTPFSTSPFNVNNQQHGVANGVARNTSAAPLVFSTPQGDRNGESEGLHLSQTPPTTAKVVTAPHGANTIRDLSGCLPSVYSQAEPTAFPFTNFFSAASIANNANTPISAAPNTNTNSGALPTGRPLTYPFDQTEFNPLNSVAHGSAAAVAAAQSQAVLLNSQTPPSTWRSRGGGSAEMYFDNSLFYNKSNGAFMTSPVRDASNANAQSTGVPANVFSSIALLSHQKSKALSKSSNNPSVTSNTSNTPNTKTAAMGGNCAEVEAVTELLKSFELDDYLRNKVANCPPEVLDDRLFVFDDSDRAHSEHNYRVKEKLRQTMRDQQGCRALQIIIDNESSKVGDAVHAPAVAINARNLVGGTVVSTAASHDELGVVSLVSRSNVYTIVIAIVITTHVEEIMCHPYGNFLAQRLFFRFSPRSRRVLLIKNANFQHSVGAISCSAHGTFAIQKIIEEIYSPKYPMLSAATVDAKYHFALSVLHNLSALLVNVNGGHVLMKWLHFLTEDYKAMNGGAQANQRMVAMTSAEQPTTGSATGDFKRNICCVIQSLFEKVKTNFMECCRDKQGCCTMQKCLDFFAVISSLSAEHHQQHCCGDAPSPCPRLFESLVEDCIFHSSSSSGRNNNISSSGRGGDRSSVQLLAADPYGNYVVTHIVQKCFALNFTDILDAFSEAFLTNNQRCTRNDILFYCTNKYASNIVECVLRYQNKKSNDKYIRQFCAEILKPLGADIQPRCRIGETKTHAGALVIEEIALHNYGNYVIQTLLTVAPADALCVSYHPNGSETPPTVLTALTGILRAIREKSFGKKFEAKIDMASVKAIEFMNDSERHRGTGNAQPYSFRQN